jgi:hypothetical protein
VFLKLMALLLIFCVFSSDGVIILWQKVDGPPLRSNVSSELMDDDDESQWEKETWRQVRALRYAMAPPSNFFNRSLALVKLEFSPFHL